MSLVVLEQVSLSFGERRIVRDLDLRIGNRDRIGLVGPNGAGKTTLLKLVAGQIREDSGTLRRSRRVRIGFLPQEIPVHGGKRLLDAVLEGAPGHAPPEGEGETDAAAPEHTALRILAGLGFAPEDRDRDLSELAGGWKMRALLASLLFQQPDLLLLDEPTNHLDMPAVAWFSAFLRRYGGAFLLVSHDREFLDEQVERIVSFEPEGVRTYTGDYDAYVRQRAAEEVVLENRARNLAQERARLERFVERFRYKASKARAVQSRVKALERMERVETHEKRKTVRFHFPPSVRAGREVVRVRGLRKTFGDRVVFDGLDLSVARGERVGLIGVNGAGKTTLLKMIAGELAPSDGLVELGHAVTVSYYAQHHVETLHEEWTAFEEVASRDPSGSRTRVQTILGAFLISGDDVEKRIAVLSGGERSRVALARILVAPGNLLLMDEPTSHLDLESCETLAEALRTFDGTIVFVSHNRSFVRRVATRIWDVADGSVETYPGTLDEYLSWHASRRESAGTGTDGPAADFVLRPRVLDRTRKREEAERRAARAQRIRPLRERAERLEREISELEATQKGRAVLLADPALYSSPDHGAEIAVAYEEGVSRLARLLAEWEDAQAELEDAESIED